jgi:hypothetical protein
MEALPVTPRWQYTTINTEGYTTTHPVKLIWRDALEVVHHIFGNPIFASHMEYDPYEINDDGEREYGEWMSSNHAFKIQASVFKASPLMYYLSTLVSRTNCLSEQL